MMKSPTGIDMAEVTRLTREGRLAQAMRLLRGAHATNQPASADATIAKRAKTDILDMEPPSAANGGAWTAARASTRAAEMPPRARATRARAFGSALGSTLDRMLKPCIDVGAAKSPPAMDVRPDARYEERTHAGAGGSRNYTLYVPSTYDASPRPLVVMLHGCTQTPDNFARGTRMNELAEEQGFLVAYPAQSQAANPSRCWNWFNASDQQRDRGEPALIADITREIMQEFAVDPGRVYVAGLSAGGAMAAIMASAYPDLYAAAGVHSGLAPGAATDMPGAFAAMRKGNAPPATLVARALAVPTIVFHGDEDATVHPLNAGHVAAHARGGARRQQSTSAGTSDEGMAYTCTIDSDVDGRPMLEQWVLHGAGHAWSGGHVSGSFVEPRGPDASRAMLRFFAEHTNTRRRN